MNKIITPFTNNKKSSFNHISEIDIDVIIHSSLTLQQMIHIFRENTGLDLFLMFEVDDKKWEEKNLVENHFRPPFCQLIHQSQKGLKDCISCHKKMSHDVIASNRPMCQHCHIGLLTVHYPIAVKNDGLGVIQTTCAIEHKGRNRLEEKAEKIAKRYKISKDELEASIPQLQILSRRKMKSVYNWLEMIVNYLRDISTLKQEESNPVQVERQHNNEIINCSSVEYLIRSEVGKSVTLPIWRASRSTGASKLLIQKVQVFIQNHYSLHLSMQIVAQALGFDAAYFSHKFKEYSKVSFITYLKQVRLTKAKEMLHNPYKTLVDIAHQCGFSDAAYFSNVFKETYGVSPSKIREEQ